MKKISFVFLFALAQFSFAQNCYDFSWAVKATGNNNYQSRKIAVDNQGNSYITGYFTGTTTFGSITLTSVGGNDIFIAKMDANGNYLWAVKAGGSNADGGLDIALDAQGNCYIVGFFNNYATFGSIGVSSYNGGLDIFLAKINASGEFTQARSLGTQSGSSSAVIAVDAQGNSYVAGVDGFGSSGTTFVSKLNPQMQFLWSESNSVSVAVQPRDIALDEQGNAYILLGDGSNQSFVFQFTSQGNSGSFNIHSNNIIYQGIATDVQGNLYATGLFQGNVTLGNTTLVSDSGYSLLVAKINPQGQYLWAVQAGGSDSASYAQGNAIATDVQGNSYVAGDFTGTAQFGSTTLASSGIQGVFVTKLSPQGDFLLALQAGGDSFNVASHIAVDAQGNSYITGQFTGTTTFGSTVLTRTGGGNLFFGDIYTAKLTTTGSASFTVNAEAGSQSVECGNSVQLNAGISGQVSSDVFYYWSPATGLDNPNIANPVASPGLNTTYTVTAGTAGGCTASASVSINVSNSNPPSVNISSNTGSFGLCNSGLTLSASGFASYEWSTGSTTPSITVTQPGTYSVTAFEASGCAGTASIAVTPLTTITAPQGTILCQSISSVQLNAGSGFDSYSWSTGSSSAAITVSQAGTYTCTVSKGSCTYTASIAVTELSGVSPANFSYSGSGLTVHFTNTTPNTGFSAWNFGDGTENTDFNATHTFASAGTYNVCLSTSVCAQEAQQCENITVPLTSGITDNNTAESMFCLYPNPGVGEYHVTYTGNAARLHLKIYDLQGRELHSKFCTASDASFAFNAVSGIYVLRVETEKEMYITKFIHYQK